MVVSMQSLTVKLQSDFALHVLFVRDPCSQSQEIEVCLGKRGGCINRNKQTSSKTKLLGFLAVEVKSKGANAFMAVLANKCSHDEFKRIFKSCPLHSHFSLNGIFGNM